MACLRVFLAVLALCECVNSAQWIGERDFCMAHAQDVFARLQVWIRIDRNVTTAENTSVCALAIETPPSNFDAAVYVAAAGINVSISAINCGFFNMRQIETTYYTVHRQMYVYMDTWDPWVLDNPQPLFSQEYENYTLPYLLEVLEFARLYIRVGCTVPGEQPFEVIPGIDYPHHSMELLQHVQRPNRRFSPTKLHINLEVDYRCVNAVHVKAFLQDACSARKARTPLYFAVHGSNHPDGRPKNPVPLPQHVSSPSSRKCRMQTVR
uniref:GM-CSF stimulating/IL-2 inhibition factor n=1 Tax=Orf virus TaxID=10258 RepID=E3TAD9_ORFV|nr:GM-CSF stimulating/IL-2 inhibition factor [Orf virus]